MFNFDFLPTTIQRLHLEQNDNCFFMKREDLLPFSFGGNKVRKGIAFLHEAKSCKSNHIVTYGTSSSNHVRVIANMCASEGLKCTIITPTEANQMTSNSKLAELYGVKSIYCSVNRVKETIDESLEDLVQAGDRPYFIPGGGHGDLGTHAYWEVYQEICRQESTAKILFDYIFLCSGTGATQAGLIAGSLTNKDDKNIVGISNARATSTGRNVISNSVKSYLSIYHPETVYDDSKVEFVDDYTCGSYGAYNTEIEDMILKVLRLDGVALDTTYTGKAFWGMMKYIAAHNIYDKNILFIHTGGTPLFFDYLRSR